MRQVCDSQQRILRQRILRPNHEEATHSPTGVGTFGRCSDGSMYRACETGRCMMDCRRLFITWAVYNSYRNHAGSGVMECRILAVLPAECRPRSTSSGTVCYPAPFADSANLFLRNVQEVKIERSRCFRITPQADLPRSSTTMWSGGGAIGSARFSYTDHHFRLGSHESMRCVAFRAEPITIIGQSFDFPHRLRVGRKIRREQKQSAFTKLAKLAIACGIGTLGYHRDLLSCSIARTNRNSSNPGPPVL